MFIEALARLNQKLQQCDSPMTIVAFIIMPAYTHSYTVESLKGQAVTKQLRDTANEIRTGLERVFLKLLHADTKSTPPNC